MQPVVRRISVFNTIQLLITVTSWYFTSLANGNLTIYWLWWIVQVNHNKNIGSHSLHARNQLVTCGFSSQRNKLIYPFHFTKCSPVLHLDWLCWRTFFSQSMKLIYQFYFQKFPFWVASDVEGLMAQSLCKQLRHRSVKVPHITSNSALYSIAWWGHITSK